FSNFGRKGTKMIPMGPAPFGMIIPNIVFPLQYQDYRLGDHQCSSVKRRACLTLKQVDTKVNENEV
ncbi:MAG: hypothetical protein IKX20_09270, partial [Paludibacteraceae bacterium]|nr:hypothetical protein [Paludibacteraceae bacterium]